MASIDELLAALPADILAGWSWRSLPASNPGTAEDAAPHILSELRAFAALATLRDLIPALK